MSEPPSWAELHARGLNVVEAAEARGSNKQAAYQWSHNNGLRWAPRPRGPRGPSAPIAPREHETKFRLPTRERPCLTCREPIQSQGAHHRLCDRCRQRGPMI